MLYEIFFYALHDGVTKNEWKFGEFNLQSKQYGAIVGGILVEWFIWNF